MSSSLIEYQVQLETKIKEQRNELRILNEKCRQLASQLKVINDIDYYKSRLVVLAPKTPYKKIIANEKYKKEIEEIFNLPFEECLPTYEKMRNMRNEIVHRHTSFEWEKPQISKRIITNKTLSELAKKKKGEFGLVEW
jgi:hypothetical protein